MPKETFTAEQIVGKPRQIEVLVNQGKTRGVRCSYDHEIRSGNRGSIEKMRAGRGRPMSLLKIGFREIRAWTKAYAFISVGARRWGDMIRLRRHKAGTSREVKKADHLSCFCRISGGPRSRR